MQQRENNPAPEVGQVWRDNDERTVVPEFTITEVGETFVYAKRGDGTTSIRIDRLANSGSRGYTYIGRSK